MNKTDLFIDKYKQLESVVRSTYNLEDRDSISYYLRKQPKLSKYKEDIRYCQDVRNLLSHKRKINGVYAVEPSDEIIEFISELIEKVKNRPLCRDIKIGFDRVLWRSLDDNVAETVKTMHRMQYTQVPVLKNGVVVGVFDESTMFRYLANNKENSQIRNLTLNDMYDFISLENREHKNIMFFRDSGYVDELEEEFEKALKQGNRISIAFITLNGKPDEKLLGIITPWDIIAAGN